MSREITSNASKRYEGDAAMQKVLGGCKLCGKPMQTNRSPLIHRTCDACKDEQLRESNRRLAARRKAKRHATKAALKPPRCQQCGEAIEGAHMLTPNGQWVRKFCGTRCRQAAFQARNVPGRRLRPDMLTSEQALETAKAVAQAERDKAP